MKEKKPLTTEERMKQLKTKLIISIVSLYMCALLAIGSVFAWFVTSFGGDTEGIYVTAVGDEDSGAVINRVDEELNVRNAYLVPGKAILLDLTITIACDSFGVNLEVLRPVFETYFASRNDLLLGEYSVATVINSGNDATETIYRKFDIDKLFEGTSLNATQISEQKMAFFKRFVDGCSLYDVIEMSVVEIDDETQSITLIKSEDSNTYYAETTPLELTVGQNVILRLEFDDAYIPTVSLTNVTYFTPVPDMAYVYVLENYNCFIGQEITLTFDSINL